MKKRNLMEQKREEKWKDEKRGKQRKSIKEEEMKNKMWKQNKTHLKQ